MISTRSSHRHWIVSLLSACNCHCVNVLKEDGGDGWITLHWARGLRSAHLARLRSLGTWAQLRVCVKDCATLHIQCTQVTQARAHTCHSKWLKTYFNLKIYPHSWKIGDWAIGNLELVSQNADFLLNTDFSSILLNSLWIFVNIVWVTPTALSSKLSTWRGFLSVLILWGWFVCCVHQWWCTPSVQVWA